METNLYMNERWGVRVTVEEDEPPTVALSDYIKLRRDFDAIIKAAMPATWIIGLFGGAALGAALAFASINKPPTAAKPVALPAVTAPAPTAP